MTRQRDGLFLVGKAQHGFAQATHAGQHTSGQQLMGLGEVIQSSFGIFSGSQAQCIGFHERQLKRDHFAGAALGIEDIGHAANNAHLHLVGQVIVTQASAAQHQAHALGLQ